MSESMIERIRSSRIVRSSLVLIAVGAGAAACSGESVDTSRPAVVTEHEYDDEDIWIQPTLIGKVMVPITHYDPEHFLLHVEQCGLDVENPSDCTTDTVEVNEKQYNRIKDGDEIVVDNLR